MTRRVEELERRCARCGADSPSSGGWAAGGAAEPTLAARAFAAVFAAGARARSGLAYAAGYAGVVYLFRTSLATPAIEWLGEAGGALLLLWGAAAPAALALGLAAAAELDRSPSKAGRAQALWGYLVGLWGTLTLIAEAREFWRLFG